MRVVVDTNVLVSGLLRSGPPAVVINAIADLRLTPVVCDAVVQEYEAVLLRPWFHFAATDVRELLVLLEQQADWVDLPAYTGIPSLPDPADWPFLACALAADYPVITGDAKHFPAALGEGHDCAGVAGRAEQAGDRAMNHSPTSASARRTRSSDR